jgi:hypothetical protein
MAVSCPRASFTKQALIEEEWRIIEPLRPQRSVEVHKSPRLGIAETT